MFAKTLGPLLNEFWQRALAMTDVDYYPPKYVVVRRGPAGDDRLPEITGRTACSTA